MEFLYGFLTVSSLSGLLVYVAVTMTKEKLNVSNNMLGTGIAVMVLGFLTHAFMVLKFIDAGGYWRDGQDFCYAALSIIGLLIGLAGIVLMAAGILKELRD